MDFQPCFKALFHFLANTLAPKASLLHFKTYYYKFILFVFLWLHTCYWISWITFALPIPREGMVPVGSNSMPIISNHPSDSTPNYYLHIDIMVDGVPDAKRPVYLNNIRDFILDANAYLRTNLSSKKFRLQLYTKKIHLLQDKFQINPNRDLVMGELKTFREKYGVSQTDAFILLTQSPWPRNQYGGMANLNAVCNSKIAHGLVSDFKFHGFFMLNTFLHEVFHMFGIQHDEDYKGRNCEVGYLMSGEVPNSRKVDASHCTLSELEFRMPHAYPCLRRNSKDGPVVGLMKNSASESHWTNTNPQHLQRTNSPNASPPQNTPPTNIDAESEINQAGFPEDIDLTSPLTSEVLAVF